MSETSRPWNGTITGDAGPYSDANWQQLYRAIIGFGAARSNSGVFLSPALSLLTAQGASPSGTHNIC